MYLINITNVLPESYFYHNIFTPSWIYESENEYVKLILSELDPLTYSVYGVRVENIDKYDAKVTICAGATVDFLAGNVKRAPRWMSDHGLEWFYRLLQEPKRMFKRYFIDDIKILKIYFKYGNVNFSIYIWYDYYFNV
mgnify:CR=1 FL=1